MREFSRKDFWSEFGERCSVQFSRDRPGVFIAQLAVFQWATRLLLDPFIQLPGLQTEDRSAAHDALLFFLKNMSVIPLSMVYVLHMAGLRPRPKQNGVETAERRMRPMLETQDLTKHFKEVKAVDSINLFIERGEIVGLLGPNGAGKTTAIAMIAALIPPTRGEVLLYGKSVIASPAPLRQILGMVPQQLALYPDLTARENLQFFGRLYGLKGKSLAVRVDEVLELVGLEAKAHRPVSTLSGGMQRRLNIGLALLHEPRFVIMDEPTVGIDPQSRHHILETVRRLNREKGMTVLYTSHYMEEAEVLCHRIYIMDQGRIIASGTPEELKSILSSDHTIELKAESLPPSFVEALRRLPAVRSLSSEGQAVTLIAPKTAHLLDDLFRLAREHGVTVTSVNIQSPSLEDVFLHLTGKALRD